MIDENGDFDLKTKQKTVLTYISDQNECSPSKKNQFAFLNFMQPNNDAALGGESQQNSLTASKQRQQQHHSKISLKYWMQSLQVNSVEQGKTSKANNGNNVDIELKFPTSFNPNFVDDENNKWASSSLVDETKIGLVYDDDDDDDDDDHVEQEHKPLFPKSGLQH
jgi:hypothetical protein